MGYTICCAYGDTLHDTSRSCVCGCTSTVDRLETENRKLRDELKDSMTCSKIIEDFNLGSSLFDDEPKGLYNKGDGGFCQETIRILYLQIDALKSKVEDYQKCKTGTEVEILNKKYGMTTK